MQSNLAIDNLAAPKVSGQPKNVVLLGVGHTHAHIVKQWAMHPIGGVHLICVTDFLQATYSGMLPGVLARDYLPDQMQIDLIQLMSAANVLWIHEKVQKVDRRRREIHFDGGRILPYDLLSVAVGSSPPPPVITAPASEHAAAEQIAATHLSGDSAIAVEAEGASKLADSLPRVFSNASAASTPVVMIKPMQTFLPRLQDAIAAAIASCKQEGNARMQIDVIGGGLGSVEVALCLPETLLANGLSPDYYSIRIISASADPPDGCLKSTKRRIAKIFESRRVQVLTEQRLASISANYLILESGRRLSTDLVIYVAGGHANPITQLIDVRRDDRHCIVTNDYLESVDDSLIWAGGDCASMEKHDVPKAGVYAVRQGPVMWDNLQRWSQGKPLRRYRPQSGFLKLVNIGGKQAIGQWKFFSFQGAWVWRLKDRIDTKFMKMYQQLPEKMRQQMSAAPGRTRTAAAAMPSAGGTSRTNAAGPAMRCLGCGGKIASSTLRSVLGELANDFPKRPQTVAALAGTPTPPPSDSAHRDNPGDTAWFSPLDLAQSSDDVAILPDSELFTLAATTASSRTSQSDAEPLASGETKDPPPPQLGSSMALSVDAFPTPLNDPWLSGRLAVVHSLSDLWASGVRPTSVLASVEIPYATKSGQRRLLKQVMSGVCTELSKYRVKLIGGHTMEGPRLTISLTAIGRFPDRGAKPSSALHSVAQSENAAHVLPGPKQGLQQNDCLLLTKPLGTGIALAALMQNQCSAATYQSMMASMLQANAIALELLNRFSVHAITDVTGFGLLGHLQEMLADTDLKLSLSAKAIANMALPGLRALVGQGIHSTMRENNEDFMVGLDLMSLPQQLLGTGMDVENINLANQLLLDPQTSGGLLIGLGLDQVEACERFLQQHGFVHSRVIGAVQKRQANEAWAAWQLMDAGWKSLPH